MAQTIYLLDTNVVSEFIKKSLDQQVMTWLQSVRLLAVSAITVEAQSREAGVDQRRF